MVSRIRSRKSTPAASRRAVERPAERPPTPRADYPIAETTPQRRLWAAYRQRGFTRASFARALGAQYSSLDHWDRGVTAMTLETFARAARIVRYSLDELVYGVPAQPSTAGHLLGVPPLTAPGAPNAPSAPAAGELTIPAQRALLAELGATQLERACFGELHERPPGAYHVITEHYARAWFVAFRHFYPTHTNDSAQAGRHALSQAVRVTADQSAPSKPTLAAGRAADLPAARPRVSKNR